MQQEPAIIEEAGADVVVVKYLETPPDEAALRTLAARLQMRPKDFIRRGEKEFKALALKEKLEDDKALFAAMAAHPKLIERSIVELTPETTNYTDQSTPPVGGYA